MTAQNLGDIPKRHNKEKHLLILSALLQLDGYEQPKTGQISQMLRSHSYHTKLGVEGCDPPASDRQE
jgi:hypothetical protein